MDVWIVTLNGYVQRVCSTKELATKAMEDIRARRKESWRPIGNRSDPDAWASPDVTSLTRHCYKVEES